MARPLKTATAATVALTESAMVDLRSARDKLARAGATAAAAKARAAIASAGGAVRHAQRRAAETLPPLCHLCGGSHLDPDDCSGRTYRKES